MRLVALLSLAFILTCVVGCGPDNTATKPETPAQAAPSFDESEGEEDKLAPAAPALVD